MVLGRLTTGGATVGLRRANNRRSYCRYPGNPISTFRRTGTKRSGGDFHTSRLERGPSSV